MPTVTSTWRWAPEHGWTSRRGRASQRGMEAHDGTCGAPLSRSPMDCFFADRAGFRVVRGDAAVRQAWGLEEFHYPPEAWLAGLTRCSMMSTLKLA
jgi:hypothetical protein